MLTWTVIRAVLLLVLLLMDMCLQQVWNDGFALLRIVLKRVLVPLVVEESDNDLVQNDETADHEPSRRLSVENDAHGDIDEDFGEIMRT